MEFLKEKQFCFFFQSEASEIRYLKVHVHVVKEADWQYSYFEIS